MKNLSTGTGLALLAGAIVAFPLVNRMSAIDQAAHAAPPTEAARAIAAASTAQAMPTIVWYGVYQTPNAPYTSVFRAWSNGRIEVTYGHPVLSNGVCSWQNQSCNQWVLVSDSNQGYNAAADINFDSKVDGDDLGQLLAAWGDAPRNDIPPSDCPLNLINP